MRRALPEVALMCLVGGTLIAGAGAAGAPLELLLYAGTACAVLVLAFLALVRRLPRRSARPRRERRRTGARFSRSPYAHVALSGVAVLAAVGAYFVVDPLFTKGRHGSAAILGIVVAAILAVIVLYDPLSSLIDRWLDRRAAARSAIAAHGESARGSEPDEGR